MFMQYERKGPSSLVPLPACHVDTGMGLERIASVLMVCFPYKPTIEPTPTYTYINTHTYMRIHLPLISRTTCPTTTLICSKTFSRSSNKFLELGFSFFSSLPSPIPFPSPPPPSFLPSLFSLSLPSPYEGRMGKDDVDMKDTAYRVVADHIRMLSIAIADGQNPGSGLFFFFLIFPNFKFYSLFFTDLFLL